MAKGFRKVHGMNEDASLLQDIVVFSGVPEVGYLTNLETRNHPGFIEKNGEKLVCLAQGGECRYNPKFYSIGMRDAKSWKTPIIQEDCPDRCNYKALVCDDHPKKCKGSITYYLEYNKFRGQFLKYCRNFDKLKKTQK